MVEVNVNKVKQVYPTHPTHNPLLFNFVEEGANYIVQGLYPHIM